MTSLLWRAEQVNQVPPNIYKNINVPICWPQNRSFFLKNNETDKIKISNFDPYNIFLAFATNIPMYDWFVVQGHICVRECVYVYVCMYIYIYEELFSKMR